MNLSVSPNKIDKYNTGKSRHQSFGTCTNPPTIADEIEYFARTEPIKASLIGASAVFLTALGIVKRKSISNFVKNLLKK